MRIGINGSTDIVLGAGVDAIARHAAEAEADGFSSYWLAQLDTPDALTALGGRRPRHVDHRARHGGDPDLVAAPADAGGAGDDVPGDHREPIDPRHRSGASGDDRGRPRDGVGQARDPDGRVPLGDDDRHARASRRLPRRLLLGRARERDRESRGGATVGDVGRDGATDAADGGDAHRRHRPVAGRPERDPRPRRTGARRRPVPPRPVRLGSSPACPCASPTTRRG